jgi:imidazolonepropionase
MSSLEIWADEIASPRSKGGFLRYSPGRMLVSSGKIQTVEKLSASKLKSASKKKILRARSIIPGFVDSHTHLVFGGNRTKEWAMRLKGVSYQEIYKKGGGIKSTVRETRSATEAQLLKKAQKDLKAQLKYGVTTIEMKSGYGLDFDSELKVLKVIQKLKKKSPQTVLSTFLGAHALPNEFSNTPDYIDYLIKNVLPKVKGKADFQDVFCEKGYFTEADSVKILNAGKKWGLRPKVHANEFGRTGGVSAACKVKAVSADHLMVLNTADMKALKKAGVVATILPGTAVFLGAKSFAPARKMWDAGLKVAIASDYNPGTNPGMNFPLCGTFAAIHQGLQLEEVLTAQTLNGALALGLKDRGCLEKGKRADFLCLDAGSFEEIYYHYGHNHIKSVYIAGKKTA